jgi:5-methyltetrahydrofolate--homocysteine methyltransferase
VYGYFPANSDGDTLIVYDPQDLSGFQNSPGLRNGNRPHNEIARFTFPRQEEYERLCLSDYFAPVGSGVVDVIAFQVVTVGRVSDDHFAELQAKHEYSEAYFFHGLAVEAAEATAEYVHQHIKRELGLTKEQGRRYSWGYPACPDLAQHELVFKLLPQTSELGMELTSAFQLVPEESTAAMVAHHPDAKYYSMKLSRLEQLEAEMTRAR